MSYNNEMLKQIATEMQRIGDEVSNESHEVLDVDSVASILDSLEKVVMQRPNDFYRDLALSAIVVASESLMYGPNAECVETLADFVMQEMEYAHVNDGVYNIYLKDLM